MSLGCGAAAGATDILGTKSRSPGMADSKGTGDCPLGRGSVLGDKGFQFRRSGFPVNKSPTIEEHSQTFTSVWFIVSGESWVEFSLVSSF
jgi:hypothetical protein